MTSGRVSIIDLGMGNLFSVKQACEHVGLTTEVTNKRAVVARSSGVILPGIGAFGAAMAALEKYDLIEALREFIATGNPLMGVCLGMQLLFDESAEFGRHEGLKIIPGKVIKFAATGEHPAKVPHVGWNRVSAPVGRREAWGGSPLVSLADGVFMYFVHSFYCAPTNDAVVLSTTEYEGTRYCSSVRSGNVFAVQFHPEKSASGGLEIYRQWGKQVGRKG
jgi:glutamine amidotransferase